jgi:tRNA threonylcarbamoyladenosine biosynthesis protein TsaE
MNRLSWWSAAEEETVRFGEILGRALAPPAWVGLTGPLGAGKTRLVQGVARGLGYTGRVRSPSFVLEHVYRGRVPIHHLDLYRLETAPDDLEASWLEGDDGVTLVEWAERVPDPPPSAHWIRLEPSGEPGRWIHLDWPDQGGRVRDFRLEQLRGRP